MSKLIKHEFRATARMMLPLLGVCVVSALLLALFNRIQRIPDYLVVLTGFVFGVSMMAIGIMGLIIIIGRFYRNTMTDTGYLTMTLPINSHQFVWGEIIVAFIWVLITAVILFATLLSSLSIMDMFSLPGSLGDLRTFSNEVSRFLEEEGANGLSLAVIIIEGIIAVLLGFVEFCLRFYSSMAVGQLFSGHRGLLSVIAYILIGILISVLFFFFAQVFGSNLEFNSDTFGSFCITAAAGLGIIDLVLLVIDTLMYLPTVFLIGHRLNLP